MGMRGPTKIPPQLPVVCVDVVHIEQVLVNLIRNAFEAMQNARTENPRVHIEVEELQGRLRICVNDNGPGVAQDDLNIFDAFATTKPTGLGLGLARLFRRRLGGRGPRWLGRRPRCGLR